MGELHAKGLLDQTLVELRTEFVCTPHINDNDARDDHNEAFTCLLAGAEIKGRGGMMNTHTDNFEGTPLSSCFQARVESPGNYIGGTTGVFILQRRPLPPKSRGPSPV